jgi:hypothetical protein
MDYFDKVPNEIIIHIGKYILKDSSRRQDLLHLSMANREFYTLLDDLAWIGYATTRPGQNTEYVHSSLHRALDAVMQKGSIAGLNRLMIYASNPVHAATLAQHPGLQTRHAAEDSMSPETGSLLRCLINNESACPIFPQMLSEILDRENTDQWRYLPRIDMDERQEALQILLAHFVDDFHADEYLEGQEYSAEILRVVCILLDYGLEPNGQARNVYGGRKDTLFASIVALERDIEQMSQFSGDSGAIYSPQQPHPSRYLQLPLLQVLYQYGADPDYTIEDLDAPGRTTGESAVTKALRAPRNVRLSLLHRLFTQFDADPNHKHPPAPDIDGRIAFITPLQRVIQNSISRVAAARGTHLVTDHEGLFLDCMQMLVRSGADVDGETGLGLSPLVYTIRNASRVEREKIMTLLLTLGADPNLDDKVSNMSPLHHIFHRHFAMGRTEENKGRLFGTEGWFHHNRPLTGSISDSDSDSAETADSEEDLWGGGEEVTHDEEDEEAEDEEEDANEDEQDEDDNDGGEAEFEQENEHDHNADSEGEEDSDVESTVDLNHDPENCHSAIQAANILIEFGARLTNRDVDLIREFIDRGYQCPFQDFLHELDRASVELNSE